MSEANSKVVYAALNRMTEDRDVIKRAFHHWREKQGDQANLNVLDTVELIETYLGLDTGEKKVLMMSMHAAASKNESQLKTVPEYISGVEGSGDKASEAAVPNMAKVPHVILTEAYFETMMAEARKRSGADAAELEDIIADEGLPSLSDEMNASVKALKNSALDLPQSASSQACKDLCHDLYMLFCDVVGPMVADDISYKAIASLLEMPEASRYDPRQLI